MSYMCDSQEHLLDSELEDALKKATQALESPGENQGRCCSGHGRYIDQTSSNMYPLVNVYITMEKSALFMGNSSINGPLSSSLWSSNTAGFFSSKILKMLAPSRTWHISRHHVQPSLRFVMVEPMGFLSDQKPWVCSELWRVTFGDMAR